MRRPRREIEIFSMSVLDMFASALGAFIMVSIILFPYYKQDMKAELTAAADAIERKRGEVRSITESVEQARGRNVRQQQLVEEMREQQDATARCRQTLAVCVAELSETFLMVVAEWKEDVDVDLVVTDPQGNEFWWYRNNKNGRQYPGSQAQLSLDASYGPALEVWLSPLAKPGDYKVEFKLPHPYGRPIPVTGYYVERTGRKQLPSKTLTDTDLRQRAGTLRLGADGKIVLQP
jgi:hypothetical protein